MIIGIPVYEEGVSCKLNTAYVEYIAAAHEPMLLTDKNDVDFMADLCDGLLLPGGVDIDPCHYGINNLNSYNCDADRDDFERRLLHAFTGLGKPVFGICRGHQLIMREVMFFGKNIKVLSDAIGFCQHINDHSLADSRKVPRSLKTHSVQIFDPEKAYGKRKCERKMFVNSMHHQGIKVEISELETLAKIGVTVFAGTPFGLDEKESKKEMIVEGVYIDDFLGTGAPVKSVQWHPEELGDFELITSFFKEEEEEEEGEPNDEQPGKESGKTAVN